MQTEPRRVWWLTGLFVAVFVASFLLGLYWWLSAG